MSVPVATSSSRCGSTVVGENALELTVNALPPGGEWYIVVELSDQLPVEVCSVVQSGRVQVTPSRFAPFGLHQRVWVFACGEWGDQRFDLGAEKDLGGFAARRNTSAIAIK